MGADWVMAQIFTGRTDPTHLAKVPNSRLMPIEIL